MVMVRHGPKHPGPIWGGSDDSAHCAESPVSAVVEVRPTCACMGRINRICNWCWRATWAELSKLPVMQNQIFGDL